MRARSGFSIFSLGGTGVAVLSGWLGLAGVLAADQPQWGAAWSRNMVSLERNLPASFDPESGKNVRWAIPLGTETHSTPVAAKGKIYLGTNNGQPRDPKHKGDRGVLMCLEEKTGKLLWQWVVPKRVEDIYFDWPNSGMSSPATVEGDRVYIVNNRGELACLDAEGLSNGNQGPFQDEGRHVTYRPKDSNEVVEALSPGPLDADILWLLNLTDAAGIWSHDAAHSSVMIRGDLLYLNSGTGVDNTHRAIRTPNAPSLIVVDKKTGRLVARDHEGIAPFIFHSTWAAPSSGQIGGEDRIFFAAGNGWVYGFEPLRSMPEALTGLRCVWKFDFDPAAPKENVHRYNSNRKESPSNFFGMPVYHAGRLYVAGGGDIWWGKQEAWLKCIRAEGAGDVTADAQVWSYPLRRHVLGTPAVHEGRVYIADIGRVLHCVDAATGSALWTHELRGEVWASPYVADGKVYLGTRSGIFYVFAAAGAKKLLAELDLGKPISATATAANGVLYVATMNRLFAVATTSGSTPAEGLEGR
jgi:outer membrane protein assembly factor BamB